MINESQDKKEDIIKLCFEKKRNHINRIVILKYYLDKSDYLILDNITIIILYFGI